jgi:hypothetical protein
MGEGQAPGGGVVIAELMSNLLSDDCQRLRLLKHGERGARWAGRKKKIY